MQIFLGTNLMSALEEMGAELSCPAWQQKRRRGGGD